MDAFFASIEMRDHPELRDRALVIGALPGERGVVSTCNYRARKFGIRSGMGVREAYALCPWATFRHVDMERYLDVSDGLHRIWGMYADKMEYVACDEAYLDVSLSAQTFDGARRIAHEIKGRTQESSGLTCSVGLSYSKAAAKTASEEDKPDGYFEIPDAASFMALVDDRGVRVLPGIGERTALRLHAEGIDRVRQIRENERLVVDMFGRNGRRMVDMAWGMDDSPVIDHTEEERKSVGREITFQRDTQDFSMLRDALVLMAEAVSEKARRDGRTWQTVTLRLTYSDMRSITRSRTGEETDDGYRAWEDAVELLGHVPVSSVRLIGLSLSNFGTSDMFQQSLGDAFGWGSDRRDDQLLSAVERVCADYGIPETLAADGRRGLAEAVERMSEVSHERDPLLSS